LDVVQLRLHAGSFRPHEVLFISVSKKAHPNRLKWHRCGEFDLFCALFDHTLSW